MLRKVTWLLLIFVCACKKQLPIGDHPRQLVGTWELLIRSDCKGYGLKSDILLLHPDGTFEQHVVAIDGRQFDTPSEHWKFVPDHSVELDKRHDFFTSQGPGSLVGLAQREVLTVELGSPSVIVLNPASDCVYKKTQ